MQMRRSQSIPRSKRISTISAFLIPVKSADNDEGDIAADWSFLDVNSAATAGHVPASAL
jgi:hypothetical protein